MGIDDRPAQLRQTSWRNRDQATIGGYDVRVEGMGRRYLAGDWEEALAVANRSIALSPRAMKVTIAERRSATTGLDVAALCRLFDGALAFVDYRLRTIDGQASCLVTLRGKKVKYLGFAKAADEATAIELGKELLGSHPDASSTVVEAPNLEQSRLGTLHREATGITYVTAAEEAALLAKSAQDKSLLDILKGPGRYIQ